MNEFKKIMRSLRRIERRLEGIVKLSGRVALLEQWLTWLKGAWAALAALYGYLWLFETPLDVGAERRTSMIQFVNQHQLWMALLIVPVVLALGACATMRYNVHPGAMNSMDSAAYDALLVAEAAIDQARTDMEAGQLPDRAKSALPKLVAAYNLARQSWLTYRGAVTTKVPAETYLDQLNQNLLNLTNALRELQEAP